MIARANSMKYVVGNREPSTLKNHGIVSRGKMKPLKNTDGITKIMLICSACI